MKIQIQKYVKKKQNTKFDKIKLKINKKIWKTKKYNMMKTIMMKNNKMFMKMIKIIMRVKKI